jgi:hypothetical protein
MAGALLFAVLAVFAKDNQNIPPEGAGGGESVDRREKWDMKRKT